jgi:signal recognition particle receptor subunit beta
MAIINHAKKEINAKLVFFGPAAAGKATALTAVCRKLRPDCRSKLKSMTMQNDRMLFFDFTPPGHDTSAGYRIRFHVYTLTGSVSTLSAWKMVLKGADGLVFVADSSPGAMTGNQQGLAQLDSSLRDQDTSLDDLSCVFLYNKRDLASPLPLEELEYTLNTGGHPSVVAMAAKGEGVVEGLSRLVRLVMSRISVDHPEVGRETGSLSRGDMEVAGAAPAVDTEMPRGIVRFAGAAGRRRRSPGRPVGKPSGGATAHGRRKGVDSVAPAWRRAGKERGPVPRDCTGRDVMRTPLRQGPPVCSRGRRDRARRRWCHGL